MRATDLSALASLRDPRAVETLRRIAIITVADLATAPMFRHAELLVGLDRNTEDGSSVAVLYMRDGSHQTGLPLRAHPITALRSLTAVEAEHIRSGLRLRTIGQLAAWPPFAEAVSMLERASKPVFSEAPSAPDALIPKLIGSTQTASRLANYVKDRSNELRESRLRRREDTDDVAPRPELLNAFTRDTSVSFDLGYLAAIRQTWINAGTHLGEIMHSLALAPGESRNIAIIDWSQQQRSGRDERTRADERLDSRFQQTRAINEVVSTTAREHLEGKTQVDATTQTSGSGITGGLGGGASKSGSAGGSLSVGEGAMAALGAIVGLPLAGLSGEGKAATSSLSSGAGGIGASYVHSSGEVQGTLLTETSGEREVLGELTQNISDATVQHSSNVRALMSTVVVEDTQEGRQKSQTRNLTNYNHSHALTMQYYEVLQKYLVRTQVSGLTPVMFIPFRPLRFTMPFIKEYWQVLRAPVRIAYPARFRQFDRAVRDFDPRNNAFDPSGELSVDAVEITRTRVWSSIAKVQMTDGNPVVDIHFQGQLLDDTLQLSFVGPATYLEYAVLADEEFSTGDFNGEETFPVDANVVCRIDSSFRSKFRTEIKDAIDTANLSWRSNRDNLKEDVTAGRYSLLNPDDGVTLSIELLLTVRDANGNVESVAHRHTVSYTYAQLHNEVNDVLFSVSDVVKAAIAGTSDFNPLDALEEIENHFHLHRYGYTRYLLSVQEQEQIVDVLDHLEVQGGGQQIPLTRLVDPAPLAVVGNTLIVKLRTIPRFKGDPADSMRAICADYVTDLRASTRNVERWTRNEAVYLPSAGLFGEAVLGRSNASEFIDLRRFFNWQDSPIPNAAPAIVAVDLNQRRGNEVAAGLTPTVLDSTLAQVLPTAYAMPTGLASALQAVQNGQMFTDMSKTSDFTSILGNLSSLASNSAQLAGTLSGDAMAKALDSAVALGSQVAAMTKTAMGRTPVAAPNTLTGIGGQKNNIEDVANTPTPQHELSDVDRARIGAGGTDVQPCDDDDAPSPPVHEDDDPEPPDDSAAPGPGSTLALQLAVRVPAPCVRLDLTSAAWNAVPTEAKVYLGDLFTLMSNWVYSVGFDDDEGFDLMKQALKVLSVATPVVGEIVLLAEGLRALLDVVGLDEDVTADMAESAGSLVTMIMNTLQALALPAIKGDSWLTTGIRADVQNGVASVRNEQWDAPAIPYGFLTAADATVGDVWWKGEKWSAQLWSSTVIDVNALTYAATIGTDGSLTVRISGSAPLALTWAQVVASHFDEFAVLIDQLLGVSTISAALATALGVTDARTEIIARLNAVRAAVTTNLLTPLQAALTPTIDFDFSVKVSDGGSSGWQVEVTGTHDLFPEYRLSLLGPDDETRTLYVGDASVASSTEGPLGLMVSGNPILARTPVPRNWIQDWR